ncbi:MAG: polymer-forming cytoskeletal protein [Christensenellaceae bacterium]|nr:polymer-forming cytoskeletal protein [Christensenellaceae bacterium]
MDTNNKVDLTISGFGVAPGGDYGTVRISGRGKITGDITCNELIITGSADAMGAVSCSRLHITGEAGIHGDLKAKELKVRGAGDFKSSDATDDFSVSGTAHAEKSINAGTAKISGSVHVKGDLLADSFSSSGMFEVSGLLSADTVDITLDLSTSKAREIGGERITAKVGVTGLSVLRTIFTLGTHTPRLEADSIEGSSVWLEQTRARVVRGHDVTLGDGCDIVLVEYSGTLHKSGNVRVGEERKLG